MGIEWSPVALASPSPERCCSPQSPVREQVLVEHDEVYLGICGPLTLMQADASLEKASVTLHTFGFTTILRPPGAEADKHAKAIARKLGVGEVISEPRLCCP